MELIMVILIIGIVSGMTMTLHTRSRERAMNKQGESILMLIRGAQKTYEMERNVYLTPGGTTVPQLNRAMALDLINDGNWGSYNINSGAGFTASIRRNSGGYDRTLSITAGDETVTCSGNCP